MYFFSSKNHADINNNHKSAEEITLDIWVALCYTDCRKKNLVALIYSGKVAIQTTQTRGQI